MKRLWLVPLILVLIAAIGAAGYQGYRSGRPTQPVAPTAPPTTTVSRGDVEQVVTAPGQLVGTREVLLGLGVAGRLSRVAVRTGDRVKAGELLAQIDDTDLRMAVQTTQASLASAQAGLASAQAGVASAQARLAEAKAPPQAVDVAAAQAKLESARAAYEAAVSRNTHAGDQIASAKAQLDKAGIAVQSAQRAYDGVSWRPDVGMTPQAAALQQATIDFEAARANYNLAVAGVNDSAVKAAVQSVAQAEADLAKVQAPPTAEALAIAQAAVESAQASVKTAQATVQTAQANADQAQARLAQARLLAPFDGIVLELKAGEGESLNAGQALVRLADPRAIEARATVVEEDFPSLQVGQAVELFFDARPELSVKGRVARIVPARDPGTSPVYPMYITLDEVPDGLAAGMTLDASVQIAARTNVLRLPRSLARARPDGSALVKVWDGSAAVDRTIKVGLRGNQYVEVLEGLRAGEQVVSR